MERWSNVKEKTKKTDNLLCFIPVLQYSNTPWASLSGTAIELFPRPADLNCEKPLTYFDDRRESIFLKGTPCLNMIP